MPTFFVRFKGLLFRQHCEQLRKAGIVLGESEPSLEIGGILTGEPIQTATVEAESEEAALEAVERALGRDSFNFSDWEAGPLA
ncbi:MAG: hypothetical protein M3335_06715 [Actinomycetota bacterium]|nr:hypothetical protein [Actinomycetota bacterium]